MVLWWCNGWQGSFAHEGRLAVCTDIPQQWETNFRLLINSDLHHESLDCDKLIKVAKSRTITVQMCIVCPVGTFPFSLISLERPLETFYYNPTFLSTQIGIKTKLNFYLAANIIIRYTFISGESWFRQYSENWVSQIKQLTYSICIFWQTLPSDHLNST
jgi:hypothetical protein